jgi:hypothetical protein
MVEIDEAKVDQQRKLPWLPIGSAPKDGTRVWLHRIGVDRPYPKWAYAEIGHYEEKPDGLNGWFADDGSYHSPWPYEKARRIGMMAMVGGKHKTKIRNATPQEFRDVLISMARSVRNRAVA